jgi:hypothetical protein
MLIRFILLLPVSAFISCTSAAKKAELDRQNIFFAEFYYEQGFPARSIAHARKIKPDSPNYAAAQDWIERASYDGDEPDYSE